MSRIENLENMTDEFNTYELIIKHRICSKYNLTHEDKNDIVKECIKALTHAIDFQHKIYNYDDIEDYIKSDEYLYLKSLT